MGLIVDTDAGKLEGREKNGVLLFAGIPFAAPPVGARRFRPPEPVSPWDGTRDATRFAKPAPQGGGGLGTVLAGPADLAWDEDCLYLNVQTPALDDARRPVMVWIHGGAFIGGTGATPWYDGSRFVTRGDVVVVTINYRLGALGWLELGAVDDDYRGAGNNGLLDQVAALDWVRRNIAAFGGDPDDVTIFGESAGGMSVGTLLGTPAAAGLFHRAIPQSGAAHNISSLEDANEVTAEVMEALGVTTVEQLVALDAQQILDAQTTVSMSTRRRIGASSGLPFGPVHDGEVLPVPPIEAVRNGSARDVALLVGTNRDEWNLFAMAASSVEDEAVIARRLSALIGDPEVILAAYRDDSRTHDEVWSQIMTDAVFRIPAIRLAEAQAAHQPDHTFMYLFEWPTPAFGGQFGATHAVEIPFVFDTLDRGGADMLVGSDPPHELALAMQDAWLAFVRNDDPNHDGLPAWPAYDTAGRATMHFGTPCHLEHDPEPATREAWSGVR